MASIHWLSGLVDLLQQVTGYIGLVEFEAQVPVVLDWGLAALAADRCLYGKIFMLEASHRLLQWPNMRTHKRCSGQ
tara:strand:+ start:125 stop:352 length:228 start_codon:yes stop_codon:yes gene_type:complete